MVSSRTRQNSSRTATVLVLKIHVAIAALSGGSPQAPTKGQRRVLSDSSMIRFTILAYRIRALQAKAT